MTLDFRRAREKSRLKMPVDQEPSTVADTTDESFNASSSFNNDDESSDDEEPKIVQEIDNTSVYCTLLKIRTPPEAKSMLKSDAPKPDIVHKLDEIFRMVLTGNQEIKEEIPEEEEFEAISEPHVSQKRKKPTRGRKNKKKIRAEFTDKVRLEILDNEDDSIQEPKKFGHIYAWSYFVANHRPFDSSKSLEDTYHGQITFFFWFEERDIPVYCHIRSRHSQLWTKTLYHREKNWAKQVARSILDPNNISNSKVINYLGMNASLEVINYKTTKNKPLDLSEKYGVWKEINAQVLPYFKEDTEYQKMFGKDIHWIVQAGQIKTPVRDEFRNEFGVMTAVAKVVVFLDHWTRLRSPSEDWEFQSHEDWLKLIFLEEVKDPEHVAQQLMDELKMCVEDDDYKPELFQVDDRLRSAPSHEFVNSINCTLHTNDLRKPWFRNGQLLVHLSGSDIIIKDIIDTVKHHKIPVEEVTIKWDGPSGAISIKQPIVDTIATFVPEDIVKLGNQFYRVRPGFDADLKITKKFQDALREHLLTKGGKNARVLEWVTTTKSTVRITFTLDELAQECAIGSASLENVKVSLGQALFDESLLIGDDGSNNFYKGIPANHCLLKEDCETPEMPYILAKCENINDLEEDMKILQKPQPRLCSKNSSGNRWNVKSVLPTKAMSKIVTSKTFQNIDIKELMAFLLEKKKSQSDFSLDELFTRCGELDPSAKAQTEMSKILSTSDNNELKIYDGIEEELLKECLANSDCLSKRNTQILAELMLKGKFKEMKPNQIQKAKQRIENLPSSVCKRDENDNNRVYVARPYLTKEAVKKINEDDICIARLLQFLRSRLKLSEGQYNELYHLSNCPCHSNGWVYIVGDRILVNKTTELFDVLAYNQKMKQSQFFHVKNDSKSDTNAVRPLSCQVSVAGKCLSELTQRGDTLAEFYDNAVDIKDSLLIHKLQLRNTILTAFSSKEDFVHKIGASSMTVCFALASAKKNGPMNWEFIKRANLNLKLEDVLQTNEIEIFKSKRLISTNLTLTQKVLDLTLSKIEEYGLEPDVLQRIFNGILKDGGKTAQEVSDMFHMSPLIRIEINRLVKEFQEYKSSHAHFGIIAIPAI